MPRERGARVVAFNHEKIQLRLETSCAGCRSCAGGCDFVRALAGRDVLTLQRSVCPSSVQIGQRLQLRLRDSEAVLAWSAYGLPTVMLILGALLGALLAWLLDVAMNAGVLLGVLLGTFLSFARSNAAPSQPFEVSPAADESAVESR